MWKLWAGCFVASLFLTACLELQESYYQFPCAGQSCDGGSEVVASEAVKLDHLWLSPGTIDFSKDTTRYFVRLLQPAGVLRLWPEVASSGDAQILISGQPADSKAVFSQPLTAARGEVTVQVLRTNFASTTYIIGYERVDACDVSEDTCGDACCSKGSWNMLTPTVSPPERESHSLVYQAHSDTVLLAGGEYGTTQSIESWTWSPTEKDWQGLAKNPTPDRRQGAAMAYDPVRRKVLLFGGGRDLLALDETWEWSEDSQVWTKLSVAPAPGPRWGHAMAYDERRDRIVLFGGAIAEKNFQDTWEWDGNGARWTRLMALSVPSARYGHAMAYDSMRERIVLFGGSSEDVLQNDTWDWDGGNWYQRNSDRTPDARRRHAMAFDSSRGRLVLAGGDDWNDVWEWDGLAAQWHERVLASPPTRRRSLAMVYRPSSKRFFVFGSSSSSPFDQDSSDTWELVLPTSAPVTKP